jgi:hypothetical protein
MSQNTTSFSLEAQISSTRSVFDILWSCLFTIFACTWTVQHLNVPPQREEIDDPGWKGDLKYAAKNFWTSAKWMITTVLAPEVLITLNAGHLAWALENLNKLKRFAEEDGVPWSMTHSLFANMGGFVVREFTPDRLCDLLSLDAKRLRGGNRSMKAQVVNIAGDGVQAGQQVPAQTTDSAIRDTEISQRTDSYTTPDGIEEFESSKEGVQHAAELLTGSGNALHDNVEGQPHAKPRTIFLLAHEMLLLRKKGIIRLPYITRNEIMDKGKSDSFARVIAVCQTLWLVVQMLVRSGRHLEVSQLEIGTTAFAFCAIIIYALNWHEPKNVGVPWTLCSFARRMPDEMLQALPQRSQSEWFFHQLFPGWTKQKPCASFISNSSRYLTRDFIETDDTDTAELFGFALTSMAFGAIHFAAINSQFPSHTERILWCVASAICTSIMLLIIFDMALPAWFYSLAKHTLGVSSDYLEARKWALRMLIYLTVLVYILARFFLIVELFRCLFFLPPSAFVSTWVSSVPHVS